MKAKLGIIAEDNSDVEVLREIISKVSQSTSFSIERMLGRGSGRLLSKCASWARQLRIKGCNLLIVVHDLDEKNLQVLNDKIRKELINCAISKFCIVIPVREIEAWLLADENAIRVSLGIKQKIAQIPSPETILDPKRRLEEIIYTRSGRRVRYLNTLHNSRIAQRVSLKALRRCSSFLPLEKFLRSYLT